MRQLAETWSGVSEKQISRLEVVDNSLLVRLGGGHCKGASEFNHLETGTVKLRHHTVLNCVVQTHSLSSIGVIYVILADETSSSQPADDHGPPMPSV